MPCKYLVKWETGRPWLKAVKDAPDRAYCKLCVTDFSVSSSGVSQVNSQAKGSKHAKMVKKGGNQPELVMKQGQLSLSKVTRILPQLDHNQLVTNAEIYQTLHVAETKQSFSSTSDDALRFQKIDCPLCHSSL